MLPISIRIGICVNCKSYIVQPLSDEFFVKQ